MFWVPRVEYNPWHPNRGPGDPRFHRGRRRAPPAVERNRTNMDSLAFLERADQVKVRPVYALTGDEAFLKRQVLAALRRIVLGVDGDDTGLSNFSGEDATWA